MTSCPKTEQAIREVRDGWLIRRNHDDESERVWWTGEDVFFTADRPKAVHFATREDAQKVITGILQNVPAVVDWIHDSRAQGAFQPRIETGASNERKHDDGKD